MRLGGANPRAARLELVDVVVGDVVALQGPVHAEEESGQV
jgi:hypothetical protein